MIQILPYMMYLKTLVKILLPVMDLNISNKTQNTSKNTHNSDFLKNREIWFSSDISRSSAPYAPFSPLPTLILYNFRSRQPQLTTTPPLLGTTPSKTHINQYPRHSAPHPKLHRGGVRCHHALRGPGGSERGGRHLGVDVCVLPYRS